MTTLAPMPPLPPEPPTPPTPPAPGASPSPAANRRVEAAANGGCNSAQRRPVRRDARGTITFTDDLTDVQSLSDGGTFTMRDWSHGVPRTVEITSAGGKLTRSYYVGGLSRPWDEDARRFLATQLPVLVRRSGLGADARVKSIFEKKGVNGVLEEIDLLGGDYARVCIHRVIDLARFDSNGVKRAGARGAALTSDYDRRQCGAVATRVTLDQAGAAAYVQAMASMKSTTISARR